MTLSQLFQQLDSAVDTVKAKRAKLDEAAAAQQAALDTAAAATKAASDDYTAAVQDAQELRAAVQAALDGSLPALPTGVTVR